MPFSKLGLTPTLCAPLARLGYLQPTPVQSASIPVVLKGTDLLARAQTGTGKTAAFGLPMIDRLHAGGIEAAHVARSAWCWYRRVSWRFRSRARCRHTARRSVFA